MRKPANKKETHVYFRGIMDIVKNLNMVKSQPQVKLFMKITMKHDKLKTEAGETCRQNTTHLQWTSFGQVQILRINFSDFISQTLQIKHVSIFRDPSPSENVCVNRKLFYFCQKPLVTHIKVLLVCPDNVLNIFTLSESFIHIHRFSLLNTEKCFQCFHRTTSMY